MNIDPDIHVEKTKIINQSIEELYRFIEELEQQVREDLHRFQPTGEIDDTPRIKIKYAAGEIKG
jgi:uncharacterized protein YukE